MTAVKQQHEYEREAALQMKVHAENVMKRPIHDYDGRSEFFSTVSVHRTNGS